MSRWFHNVSAQDRAAIARGPLVDFVGEYFLELGFVPHEWDAGNPEGYEPLSEQQERAVCAIVASAMIAQCVFDLGLDEADKDDETYKIALRRARGDRNVRLIDVSDQNWSEEKEAELVKWEAEQTAKGGAS